VAANPNPGRPSGGGSIRAQNANNRPSGQQGSSDIGAGFATALKDPRLQEAAQNQDRGFFGNLFRGVNDFFSNIFDPGSDIDEARNRLPDDPNFQENIGPTREQTIEELERTEEARFQAAREDQQRADLLGETIRQDTDEAVSEVDEERDRLLQSQEELNQRIDENEARIDQIGENVDNQFQQAQEQFRTASQAALSNVREDRDDALKDVYRGQNAAAEAAVAGVHGQVRSAMARIDSNQNLSPAQKEQMKAQVSMNGALNLNAAVGQNMLQFNTLAANTATQFGQILGGLESVTLQGEAGLGQARAQASLEAQTAAAELGNELVGIRANADQAYSAQQGNLLMLRTQAQLTGNELAVNLLPAQASPYIDYSGSALTNLDTLSGLLTKQFSGELGVSALDVQAMAAKAAAGDPISNVLGILGIGLGG